MSAGRSAAQQVARKREKAAALRRQADRLDQDADRWELGDQGERIVGAHLEELRAQGWYVVHDVRWPGRLRANVDHVVVGPAGVIVVDAKNWSGAVSVDAGRLRQNGQPRDREAQAVAEAAAAVGAALGSTEPVRSVLCLAQDDAREPAVVTGGTVVVSAGSLVGWASSLPARLPPDEVLRLAALVRQELPPAGVPRAGSTRHRRRAPAARARRVGPRRRRTAPHRKPGLRTLLIRLAVGVAALVCLPFALHQLADGLTSAASDVPDAAAATPTVAAPVVYPGCTALRATYPNGVKAKGAVNAGRKARPASAVDTALVTANGRLDADGDGLVCERPPQKARAAKHHSAQR